MKNKWKLEKQKKKQAKKLKLKLLKHKTKTKTKTKTSLLESIEPVTSIPAPAVEIEMHTKTQPQNENTKRSETPHQGSVVSDDKETQIQIETKKTNCREFVRAKKLLDWVFNFILIALEINFYKKGPWILHKFCVPGHDKSVLRFFFVFFCVIDFVTQIDKPHTHTHTHTYINTPKEECSTEKDPQLSYTSPDSTIPMYLNIITPIVVMLICVLCFVLFVLLLFCDFTHQFLIFSLFLFLRICQQFPMFAVFCHFSHRKNMFSCV